MIKYKFLLLVLFFLGVTEVKSQISVGVLAGSSISKFKRDFKYGKEEIHSLTKASVAVLGEFSLTNEWAIRAELQYTRMGTKITDNSTSPPYYFTADNTCLNLPLSLKYEFFKGPFKAYIYGGGMTGFILHYKNTVARSGNGVYIHNTETEKNSKYGWTGIHRNTMSALGGFGLKYTKGKGSILFDVSYIYGFSIINTNQVLTQFYPFNYQRGVNLSVGYALNLGKSQ